MEYKLIEYSYGVGCGCKIVFKVLDEIFVYVNEKVLFFGFIVGNDKWDDVVVFDLGDGIVIVSIMDFFMFIVDDLVDFGWIVFVNVISDIYVMGVMFLVVIVILGWLIDKLLFEVVNLVIEGGCQVCQEVGIFLVGGYSIDSLELIFGFVVIGWVKMDELKMNGGVKVGDVFFLIKFLGVGIFSMV